MVWWLFSKRGINNRIDELHVNLADSFSNLKKDIKGTVQWIEHLNSKNKDHHEQLKSLNMRVNSLEEAYNEMREYLAVQGTVQSFMNVATDKLRRPINVENELPDRSRLFMNVQTFMNVATIEKLSPAQKNIVALLVYSGEPLGYDDISRKLALSEITIRRHMGDIKKFGFKINEKLSVKGRKKLFFFEDRTKKLIVNGKVSDRKE